MKESIIKVASALYKQGYRKGDVAILLSLNCPEYTIVFIALACIGVVVSTANPIYTSGNQTPLFQPACIAQWLECST